MQGTARPWLPPGAEHQLLPGGLEVPMPDGRLVRQRFDPSHVDDIPAAVHREFTRMDREAPIAPGERIAIAVGSRGIARLAEVVTAVVRELRAREARPFIVPAMGSHGGATAEGQVAVLAEYGITEERVGAPIRASMEVVELGRLEAAGLPVYFDREASQADGIVVINRVKLHTCFRGPIESGLVKMLAIGLGNHMGAATLHSQGFPSFPRLLPHAAQVILARMPVRFGIALVENAFEQLAHLEAVPAAHILQREPELLAMARQRMGRLLVDEFEVLIVDEIGKNVSGDGMDPNVTGRYIEYTMHGGPRVQKIVVLGLTPDTHGNASGIGMADVTTQAVLDAIDLVATYTNSATSTLLHGARLPVVMPTARAAVALALRTLNRVSPERARVIRIKNTLELERIWMSEALWQEVADRPEFEALSGPAPLAL